MLHGCFVDVLWYDDYDHIEIRIFFCVVYKFHSCFFDGVVCSDLLWMPFCRVLKNWAMFIVMDSTEGWSVMCMIASLETCTHLTALSPGVPRWAITRKVKPIWILLKQETVSGISGAVCKSSPHSRLITTQVLPLIFYRPDALPAAYPTAPKHWRQ